MLPVKELKVSVQNVKGEMGHLVDYTYRILQVCLLAHFI